MNGIFERGLDGQMVLLIRKFKGRSDKKLSRKDFNK